VSHGNASRRSCARPPNDPRARPPRGTYRPQPPLASSARPGDSGRLCSGLSDRTRQASIDRILTQVPRLTDAVAGAEFEGDLAFLAGRPTPRRSVTLPRRCEHVPAEPAHARCGRRAGSAGGDSPFGKGAVLVHRFDRPLATEMDESEQRGEQPGRAVLRCRLEACCFDSWVGDVRRAGDGPDRAAS
jgi:hypothetical protein